MRTPPRNYTVPYSEANKASSLLGMKFIIKYKYLWLVAVGILVFLGILGTERLEFDSSNESYLYETDELMQANDRFKEIFGNEEFILVLLESENIWDKQTLKNIRNLQLDLENRLPFIKKVDTIMNIDYINVKDDVLQVEDLIGEHYPGDNASIEEIKIKIESSKLYLDRLVTPDWQNTVIFITFERVPKSVWLPVKEGFTPLDQVGWPNKDVIMSDRIFFESSDGPTENLVKVNDPKKLIAPAFQVIIKNHLSPKYKLTPIGVPIGDFEADRVTSQQGEQLGTIAFFVVLLFLLVLYRNPIAVITPLLVIICTMIILFGIMGWTGIKVSMISMVVGPLLMVISVSYSIHVINHFRKSLSTTGNRYEALRYTYSESAWPCFLTAITTAIGFTSFSIVSMKPVQDLGLVCAMGVLITYCLVMILVPIGVSFGKSKKTIDRYDKQSLRINKSNGMKQFSVWVSKHKILIVVISLVIAIGAAAFIPKIKVETDYSKMLGEKVGYIKDMRHVVKHLGGAYSYELLIELPSEDMAKEPEVLKALDALAEQAKQLENTRLVDSLTDIVKEINTVMHNRSEAYYRIPDKKDEIAQYLLFYEMAGGEEVTEWVDYKYQKLRLSIQVDSLASMDAKLSQLKMSALNTFPEGTQISIVGDIPIMLRLIDLLTEGQIKSILLALVSICIFMIVILKSLKAGIISMIPNIFPVLITTGLLGLLDINLDMFTIMIAPMIIGIAVDDTVHFFYHFKKELNSSTSYQMASERTFAKIGQALLFTSFILIIGFGLFGFSNVASLLNMGILSAAGILAALVADFFIAPVLLLVFKPFGK